jgi:hypothetical protein
LDESWMKNRYLGNETASGDVFASFLVFFCTLE